MGSDSNLRVILRSRLGWGYSSCAMVIGTRCTGGICRGSASYTGGVCCTLIWHKEIFILFYTSLKIYILIFLYISIKRKMSFTFAKFTNMSSGRKIWCIWSPHNSHSSHQRWRGSQHGSLVMTSQLGCIIIAIESLGTQLYI